MNKFRFLTFVLLLGTIVLSACGAGAIPATPAPVSVSQKVEAMPVAFVGIIDSIAGDQWVISGTTVTVNESIVRDGPFTIGDRIKVEGLVNPDGSLTVSRVEAPAAQETATQPPLVVDNANEALENANTNDANINDDSSVNSNDSNTNDDDSANTNDDNSNGSNVNDDSGNINDDNSNDSNTNDDNGGNDNGDDDGGNSNDDHGNDDNSGGGGGKDDNGDDDNGSGGNGSDD